MTAVTGAVAQTPELLVTIESRQNSDFIFGSMTFGGKAIVTFSNDVGNVGDNWGWYTYPGSGGSLLTVTSVEGYTITSCKFYTEGSGDAVNGYTIEGESPSVYLINIGVFTDASQSVKIGDPGITKIEVYGYVPAPAVTEYYLVGNMTSWGINPQYKLALNESADDANEYQIAVVLPAATELKVVSSTDGTTIKGWFPAEAGNKVVENDGLYTIYFRPNYNGGDDWHAKCIYVADGVSFTADGTAWTLAQMPACDLELEVEYYPLATLATTPAAADGLTEGTTAALLTAGTSAEGTLNYAIGESDTEAPTTGWSEIIPTAEGLDAGTYYVWYKVVGDAEHSDSEPQSIAVTIAALPAFAVTIDDAGVDASNWQATPAEQRAGQTVTLSYGGKKKVKSITIEKAAPATVPVTAITLNKTATTISAGQTETLSVSSVTPDDATDQTVTWSSDNEAVATVNATTGEVTAVAFGTANITATANDGSGVTATCAVTVSKVVTINQSDWGMNYSFTKDGVTVSADYIDSEDGNIMGPGTFSTTLGNFTKIVVTSSFCDAYGTGWSSSWSSSTWAGTPASTVSFSGSFSGMGEALTTIVCTIVPKN